MHNNMNSAQDCEQCKSETKHKSEIALVNRIAGQVNAVGRMIEEDRYCPDKRLYKTSCFFKTSTTA